MSTKKLAKELGLLRQRSQHSGSKKSVISNQIFSFLIVIDFESTCWREKNNYGQEIIEFPAVLLNTSTGEVESEFHTYVQPQEHPILSQFCTELTGITQMQVEAGIPLQICLSRFTRWLQNLQLERGVVFPNKQQKSSGPLPSQKLCTFLTWSDWDLGVCLQYECKRKQLHKPDVLNSWIDLRSTYRLFYDKKPKGLNGALQDLGIQFAGREHSGLDDARNTAHLAARMMRDGCVMKITRSLERTPVKYRPVLGNSSGSAGNKKEKHNTNEKENSLTTGKLSKIPPNACQKGTSLEDITQKLDTKKTLSSIQEPIHSLISPKTLLNSTTLPLCGPNRRSVTAEINFTSPHNNSNLVLCSTTVSCFSNVQQPNQVPTTEATSGLMDGEKDAILLVETEERCGSYDDVVLEGDETDEGCSAEYLSEFDSGCYEWKNADKSHSPEGQCTLKWCGREKVTAENKSKQQKATDVSTAYKSPFLAKSHINVSNHVNEMTTGSDSYFAVPKTVTRSKSILSKAGLKASLQAGETSQTNTLSTFRAKPFVPATTSTPNVFSTRPKPVVTQHTKQTSFTIYTEPAHQAAACSRLSSHRSLCTPRNILSSLSNNTLSSCANRSSFSMAMKGAQKITSPLCACGRRAKRQVVSNGGPNHGRGFYCCPVRRSGSRGRMEKGCEFFKWESALMKSSSVATPAVKSSISLCHTNSTVLHRPPHRSSLRKSY
ncbi:ERI1 exoribonuclease 2 [Parambassis ranga]|uniref:ERI1 exoribonuclease 2 n=1 Tax=Parambassis ranga TaxID=210632 RepID=A0A6P7IUG7_9TELE|nr:ERI1 exoribonuclease 2 [Parambassis ranga]